MDRAQKEYVESYYAGLAHPWLWGTFLMKVGRTLDSKWLNNFTAEKEENLLAAPLEGCEEVLNMPKSVLRGKTDFKSLEDLCALGPWLDYYASYGIMRKYIPMVDELGYQEGHYFSYMMDRNAIFTYPTLSEEYRRDLFFHSWRTSVTDYVIGKALGSLEYLIEYGGLNIWKADQRVGRQVCAQFCDS